jgi:hypothetical protein
MSLIIFAHKIHYDILAQGNALANLGIYFVRAAMAFFNGSHELTTALATQGMGNWEVLS